ncbi:hypothetical protein [Methanosarcina sp.]|uniref:hypothetical protein n=1 Tax=Methanosarcina sp. TaxID=2213 RepID=UPI003C766A01
MSFIFTFTDTMATPYGNRAFSIRTGKRGGGTTISSHTRTCSMLGNLPMKLESPTRGDIQLPYLSRFTEQSQYALVSARFKCGSR